MKIAVIGAGIWGSSTAYYLQKNGHQVRLFDMWGPGNVLSGSGGTSRIIRLVYGADPIYTDLTFRAYDLWWNILGKKYLEHYQETGILWFFPGNDANYVLSSRDRILDLGHAVDEVELMVAELTYPQISFEGLSRVFHEPKAGILAASKCCKSLVDLFISMGGQYLRGTATMVDPTSEKVMIDGQNVVADRFIFATGPWTQKLFPEVLAQYTYISKQEVYHFSAPTSVLDQFYPPQMPMWLEYDPAGPLYYGMPMHLGKGFKIAYDDRSTIFNLDEDDRTIDLQQLESARTFIGKRFPALAGSPLSYAEVCQYDNSIDGHFIIDYHPFQSRFLLMCGSSGHGFKMGPAIGKLISDHISYDLPLPIDFKLQRFQRNPHRQSQFLPNPDEI